MMRLSFLFAIGVLSSVKLEADSSTTISSIDPKSFAFNLSKEIPFGTFVSMKGNFIEKDFDQAGKESVHSKIDFETDFNVGDPEKCRITCSPYLMAVQDPPGKFIRNDMTFIGTGDKWVTLLTTMGFSDAPRNVRRAYIDATKPKFLGDLEEDYISGMSLFSQNLKLDFGMTLWQILTTPNKNPLLKISVVKNQDGLEVTCADVCTKVTVLLDPDTLEPKMLTKLFNICRPTSTPMHIEYDFSGKLDIPGYPSGIPSTLTRKIYLGTFEQNESTTTITSISTQATMPPDLLQVNLPPDWMVNDRMHNVIFRTGQNPSDTLQSLNAIISKGT